MSDIKKEELKTFKPVKPDKKEMLKEGSPEEVKVKVWHSVEDLLKELKPLSVGYESSRAKRIFMKTMGLLYILGGSILIYKA